MSEFIPNQPIETTTASIEVTINPASPLKVGTHRFQLVVVDDSGNQSLPKEATVVVKDTTLPIAELDAPPEVNFGESFTLSGARSSDAGGGQVAKFIWTLLE
jgi:chitodextrinase